VIVRGRARRWRVAAPEPSAASLAAALDIPPLLAHLLLRRGCTDPGAARAFLDVPLADLEDPFRMAGMAAATRRLQAAVRDREPIRVCGDFDADGVCGTAVLVAGLRQAGAVVDYVLPRRLTHGYGLPVAIVEEAASTGIRLLVAVDHGVTAHAALGAARDRGLDVIVCDHHLPPAELPPAVAILNPRRPDCGYPCRELCGAGIGFKLLQGLPGADDPKQLWPLLELVALATVADLAPLTGENRVLVAHGLSRLAATERPGLRALAEVAGVTLGPRLGPAAVGFGLAPRLNAAGRLDDARAAVRLLLTEDPTEARELAEGLDRQNRERQALEAAILEDALRQLECRDLGRERAIVLASAEWHPGVLGIVAARLVERFGLPTALITLREAQARGSARSAAGWHVTEALARCADLLLHYGGHRAAAGFSLPPGQVDAFRARFLGLAAAELTPDDLAPVLDVDGEVSLDDMRLDLADALGRLAPHGIGNPEPVLVARSVQVMRFPRVVGRKHLRCKVRQSPAAPVLDAIGFNLATWLPVLDQADPPRVDLAFTPERHSWNGKDGLQVRVKDVRVSEHQDSQVPARPAGQDT
jgi:single-stranded-DNA-specific exonuclease